MLSEIPPEQGEACFIIIKPDAMERGLMGKIISRFEETYLQVSGMQQRRKSPAWVAAHYEHLVDAPFFQQLVDFMTARTMLGFVVSGPYACRRCRNLVGLTDSTTSPAGTIRGDYGNFPIMFNCVHASENQDNARREWTLYYDTNLDWKDE